LFVVVCSRSLAGSLISNLADLEYLTLRGNQLTRVQSQYFHAAPILKWVDMRDNLITSLEYFGQHPTLAMVLLSNNSIQVMMMMMMMMMMLMRMHE
jgi:Leucine-rich repeat (LRR) protein